MRKVSFSQTEWSGDLSLRLDWVMSSSCELTTWPAWDFCPVVQQLVWLFSSFACFTHVPAFGNLPTASQPQDLITSLCRIHTSELFFTLSHTLPLHDSHLNTGFLNDELQENWHGIKPTEWLIKFNFTVLDSQLWAKIPKGVVVKLFPGIWDQDSRDLVPANNVLPDKASYVFLCDGS